MVGKSNHQKEEERKAKETTPLLGAVPKYDDAAHPPNKRALENWAKLRTATKAGFAFRRVGRSRRARRTKLLNVGHRESIRGSSAFPFFPGSDDEETAIEEEASIGSTSKDLIEPSEALVPLVRGGIKNSKLNIGRSYALLFVAMSPLHPQSPYPCRNMAVDRKPQISPFGSRSRRTHVSFRIVWWDYLTSFYDDGQAFIGNRVSRMFARLAVDGSVKLGIIPSSHYLFKRMDLSLDLWHPVVICVIMGILRSSAPFAASFQGSRVGRVLTRSLFNNATHRWLPIQRIQDLSLTSDDCQETDEVSENADLVHIAKLVAKALGKAQRLGLDGMEGQNAQLAKEGFIQVGSGSGGYAVYECHRMVSDDRDVNIHTLLLHITPYGPSLLDVLPRYLVLELENSHDRRGVWSETIDSIRWMGPSVVEGFAYQGAFFSPHHYAEMKETYDKQLLAYDRACKAMSRKRDAGPPTDLPSLKGFLNEGKLKRKRKQNDAEFQNLQRDVAKVARKLKSMMSTGKEGCTAPHGVILYFEGLDCSGKSSTGGLIQQALADAGFAVDMEQYNRPPSEEQKHRPWMQRFALPKTSAVEHDDDGEAGENNKQKSTCARHTHRAVVWDRGPAGDFVYGALTNAPPDEKRDRYREFIKFDADCQKNNILFIKLMFVTNRDSIASTLGKRLAQRKMTQDLRTWLRASHGGEFANENVPMEGLDFIDMHIDPTDFIAFNMYEKNLHKFVNFALNTDIPANPWVVVNTWDRFAARKQLLQIFEAQLDAYALAKHPNKRLSFNPCRGVPAITDDHDTPDIDEAEMIGKKMRKRLRMGTVLALIGLLLIVFYYCDHTTFFEQTEGFFSFKKEDDVVSNDDAVSGK
eukprot:scaffold78855_cov50-Attheya_sp.AAC.1